MQRVIKRRSLRKAELPHDMNPVLQRIYTARHVKSGEDITTAAEYLLPPSAMEGMLSAVALLEDALRKKQRISVIGDFDADGATSCALVLTALRAMGAKDIQYLVPNRFEYGYGLTPEIVSVAADNRTDLIITVDNGISSVDGVAVAKLGGMRVLVTDHHLPGASLPDADAIVNPNIPGDTFPSKHLAGVGVAFYVMLALRSHLRETGWFTENSINEPNLAELLDLVALGTVADVVPLDHNNRILVQQGLARIRAGRCRPGIQALIEVSGRNMRRLVASDLGFCLGPRLNAAGRLEDMSIGIECLLADNHDHAKRIAVQLDALNNERREIEAGMQADAITALDKLVLDESQLPLGLCLYEPGWHQGVIGILAARIKERFHRPVIAFADAGEGQLKGSARSIPGLHIRDVLDSVAAAHPDILSRFGGHAMAAGLSLDASRFNDFSNAFDKQVRDALDGQPLLNILETDGELSDDDFNLELAELLRSSGPWGQGFPEPVFDGLFRVVNSRLVGERHLKLSVVPEKGNTCVDAIVFNQGGLYPLESGVVIRLAYRLDANEFRGVCGLQLVAEYIEIIDALEKVQ